MQLTQFINSLIIESKFFCTRELEQTDRTRKLYAAQRTGDELPQAMKHNALLNVLLTLKWILNSVIGALPDKNNRLLMP